MNKQKTTIFSGKRKSAIAKVRYVPGNGIVFYNHLPYTELPLFHKLALAEPLRIYEQEVGPLNVNLHVSTFGGGKSGQIQAARLAVARALVSLSGSETLKKSYLKYDRNILVQDSRRKETRKPNDSKARAKRQKSYR